MITKAFYNPLKVFLILGIFIHLFFFCWNCCLLLIKLTWMIKCWKTCKWDYSSCHFSIPFAKDWYLSKYIEFKLPREGEEGKVWFNSKYSKTETLKFIIVSMICLLIYKIGHLLFLFVFLLAPKVPLRTDMKFWVRRKERVWVMAEIWEGTTLS